MKLLITLTILVCNIAFSQSITSIKLDKSVITITNKNLKEIQVSDQLVTTRNGKKSSYIIVNKVQDNMIIGRIVKGVPKFTDKVKKGSFYMFNNNRSNKKNKTEFNIGLGVESVSKIKTNADDERISFSPNFRVNLGLDIPLKLFKRDFLFLVNLNSNLFPTKAKPKNAPNNEEWSYYSMNFTTDLGYLITKNFYARAGVGASYLNYKGKIESHNSNRDSRNRPVPYIGDYDEKLLGVSFGPGLGYIKKTKKNKSIKVDIGFNLTKTLDAQSDNPLDLEIEKPSFNKLRLTISLGL